MSPLSADAVAGTRLTRLSRLSQFALKYWKEAKAGTRSQFVGEREASDASGQCF